MIFAPPFYLKLMSLLLKSFISLILIFLVFIAAFSMFEIFGRKESRLNPDKLRKIHKANGIVFIFLSLLLSYFCLSFIFNTKAELSPRGTFHSVLAVSIILLLIFKIAFVNYYRKFYEYAKILGILTAIITLLTISTSAGYYLLITGFGASKYDMGSYRTDTLKEVTSVFEIATDTESVNKGKDLFNQKCFFCHEAYSKDKTVGPGLKGILKEPYLPVSKKQSNAENILHQIKTPYKDMPSFSHLSDDELKNIVAFLNTL